MGRGKSRSIKIGNKEKVGQLEIMGLYYGRTEREMEPFFQNLMSFKGTQVMEMHFQSENHHMINIYNTDN